MPPFRYVAITPDNERSEGVIDTPDATTAVRHLQNRGQIVLDISGKSSTSLWAFLNRDITTKPAISKRNLGLLFREWAGLVQAGISVHEALQISTESAGQKSVKQAVARMATDVREGASLRAAMAREKSISPSYVAMVGAGEIAGDLGPTLQRISTNLEQQRAFSDRLRGALLYPAFLTVTASAAIAILLIVVVPNLESLIDTADRSSLPFVTRIVLAASEILRNYGLTILTGLVTSVTLPLIAWYVPRTRRRLDRLILKMPIAGNIKLASEISAYCRTLSALVGGGVQLSVALPLVLRTVKNGALRSDLASAHELVVAGVPLGEAMSKTCPIPRDALVVIRMGERTGHLPEMLGEAARVLSQRAQNRLETIATLVAPTLTIGFGLVAGLVVYAMLSTILGINELAFQ